MKVKTGTRAAIVHVVRTARLIKQRSAARWDICIALFKHYYATQGFDLPEDLLLHWEAR